MKGKKKTIFLLVLGAILIALFVGSLLSGSGGKTETIQEAMKDAVLHEENRMSFFGLTVNPAIISAYLVSGFLLLAAILIRIFAVPRFKEVPGRFQMLLESWVSVFTDMAKGNSPHRNQVLGGYLFFAGSFIFVSTLFELFGIQWITTEGHSISLSAPLSDINGAIGMGVFSFGFLLVSGGITRGFKGIGAALKEFSLPISMSFRLFGALLSGLLVTELVYYTISLSYVLPVVVGVLFTLLHALIQTYVLIMLVSTFYGEIAGEE